MSENANVHATCVALSDRAVLIQGQSGQGKSALGLQLLAYGCVLVADDQVQISRRDHDLVASPPHTIVGLIEARGVGILNAIHQQEAKVVLVIDLDQTETERLPQRRSITLLGCELPLIYRIEAAHFAPAVLQILKAGWSDR